MYIYIISVFTKLEENEKDQFPDLGAEEIVGYFSDFDEAEEIIYSNACDINETIYKYAALEKIRLDEVYPLAKSRIFYQWDPSIESYVRIDEPEFMKSFTLR